MKSNAIVIIFVVVVLLVAGISYYWASGSLTEKDSEISSLNEEIGDLQEKLENTIEFTTLYLKARNVIGDAWANDKAAWDSYDWGGYYYEYDNYDGADEYWTYAMDYFAYVAEGYRNSKPFFRHAENLAPTEDYADLMRTYKELAECGTKRSDYMYEASEYYAATARYYAQGKWEHGDAQLAIGNERLASHDSLVSTYNDLLAETNAIEDRL